MRKLALSLPATEEKAHFERPDFRVHNKIFAGLSRDERQGTLKLTSDAQWTLVEAKPQAFLPAAGAWGRAGWTHVVLAEVELGELAELLHGAWRLIAPKRLVAEHDARAAKPNAQPPNRATRHKPR